MENWMINQRFLRKPNGTLPVKLLELRFSCRSKERLLKVVGMLPVRTLLLRFRYHRRERLPRLGGIVPLS